LPERVLNQLIHISFVANNSSSIGDIFINRFWKRIWFLEGKYDKPVESSENSLIIDGKEYKVFSEKDPEQLPWGNLAIDVVFECTGIFTQKEGLEKHIKAGAKQAILSAPAKSEDVATVVSGIPVPQLLI